MLQSATAELLLAATSFTATAIRPGFSDLVTMLFQQIVSISIS